MMGLLAGSDNSVVPAARRRAKE